MRRFRPPTFTIADFCDDEDVSVSAFYYWRKFLTNGGDNRPDPMPNFLPVQIKFVDAHQHAEATIDILLPGGAVLRIDGHCPAESLARSIAAVLQATRPLGAGS